MMVAGYKSLGVFNQMVKTCTNFPADSYGKVVLCGHSGAGKSTLTQVSQVMYGLGTRYGPIIHIWRYHRHIEFGQPK